MDKITCVFTSCGRFDLLQRTIESFKKFNTYPIESFIVIDNSELNGAYDKIVYMFHPDDVLAIVNDQNIGQIASIDKAYSWVKTDYIFHSEDDWEYFDYGFIEKSLDILKYNDKITNVSIRVRFDGERGSMHPISNMKTTTNGTNYFEYLPNYLGTWHGFSFNPGLRRLSDYNLIKPYKQYINEQGVGQKYRELEYISACLENFYCKHIGTNSSTPKSNE